MILRVRLGLAATMLCLLAACGGGGGGSSGDSSQPPASTTPPPVTPAPIVNPPPVDTPPPVVTPPPSAPEPPAQPPPTTPPPTTPPPTTPTPTDEDRANASGAALQVSLLVNTNLLEISWTDTFTSETGFQVEARANGGTWQVVGTTAAGDQHGFYWQGTVSTSRTYRVTAVLAGYTVPLQTAAGQSEIPVDLSATPISIEMDQPAPVRGSVQLTLANAEGVEEVSYAVGNDTIGTSAAALNFPLSWNTSTVQDGPQDVQAVAKKSTGLQLFVRREVAVDNSDSQASAELIATDVSYIMATEQGAVLYEKLDGSVVLRNASGVEVTLQIPAGATQLQAFTLSGGHVAFAAAPPAAPTSTYHVYLADPSGQVTNFSEPFGATFNSGPILKYPWLVWYTGTDDHYEIHNLQTQTRTTVARPAEASETGRFGNTFVTTPGAEQLVFWANTGIGGGGSTGPYDIFTHDLTSGVTQRITNGGTRYRYLETDNTRIAWRRSDTSSMGRNLIVAPVADPTAQTTLSTAMSVYHIKDGLLTWIEPNGNGTSVLKVNDGTSTTLITSVATSAPFTADGRITFTENGQTHVWNSDNTRQVLLNTAPTYTPVHDDGIAFFVSSGQSLYRMLLP